MSSLLRYIDAWLSLDSEAIAAAVNPDCAIIECYGPIYRGRECVRQWAETWLGDGGRVHRWDITEHFQTPEGQEAAQWLFDFTWQGRRRSFEGATIATAESGLIRTLREYRTTAELYNWTGQRT